MSARRVPCRQGDSPAPAGSAGAGAGAPAGGPTGDLAGLLSGRPCDPMAFRRLYPHRWSGFLRAHFRNATEVAVFFSVNEKTARQWWEGLTGPQGWAAAYAVAAIPSASQHLLRSAA